jgi:hypothetical protein
LQDELACKPRCISIVTCMLGRAELHHRGCFKHVAGNQRWSCLVLL